MRIITLDIGKKIVEVKHVRENYIPQENEIVSDLGDIGQIMQPDGTFIDPEPETDESQTSLEDKINYIYYKQMGVIA